MRGNGLPIRYWDGGVGVEVLGCDNGVVIPGEVPYS